MRLGRIAHPEGICFAIIDGPKDAPMEELVAKEIAGTPFTPPEPTGREWKLNEVRLLAPTLPTKVVALGRNYADHVAEVFKSLPIVFLPPSSLSHLPRSLARMLQSRFRTTPPTSSLRAS